MNALAASFFRSIARRRSLAHLRELDEHLLADVGLTRAEIRRPLDRSPMQFLFGSPNR